MRVYRLFGVRKFKVHKWSQYIFVIVVFAVLCIIRADKLLWESTNCRIPGGISPGELRASWRYCLLAPLENNVDIRAESRHRHEIMANVTVPLKIQADNEELKSKPEFEIDIPDKKTTTGLNEEVAVDVIVQAYLERNNRTLNAANKTVVDNDAIYREFPPVYDNLIKPVMDTRDRCIDAIDFNGVIAVHSAPYNFENRRVFRWLYGDPAKTNPYRFKLVFFIGLVANSTLQDLLRKENEEFGDTVQGNFMDAYINMTYKAIMVFNWLDTHCKGIRTLFRLDDDVFMNVKRVYPRWNYVQRTRPAKTIMCNRLFNDRVLRTGKWAVPASLIPADKYEFMRCPGYFAAITIDLIHEINVKVREMPFFWIDDIVILGLLPNSIGNVFFYPFNKWMAGAKAMDDFYSCVRTQGPECHYWVGITEVDKFETLYGYLSGRIPREKYV